MALHTAYTDSPRRYKHTRAGTRLRPVTALGVRIPLMSVARQDTGLGETGKGKAGRRRAGRDESLEPRALDCGDDLCSSGARLDGSTAIACIAGSGRA